MPEWTKTAACILIVMASALAAYMAAEFVWRPVIEQSLVMDAQQGYGIDIWKVEGRRPAIADSVSFAVFLLVMALIVQIVSWHDRALVILGGYVGACAAAGFAITVVYWSASVYSLVISGGLAELNIISWQLFYSAALLSLLACAFVAVFAAVPALLVIIYAERVHARSPFFYGAAGALVGIVASNLVLIVITLDKGPAGTAFPSAAALAGFTALFGGSGLAGGLTYWVIAGRNAGRWGKRPAAVEGVSTSERG